MKTFEIVIVAIISLLFIGILLLVVLRPQSSYQHAPSCVDEATCKAQCSSTPIQKYIGVNLTGFDSGDNISPAQSSVGEYSCVPDALIDWNIQGQMNIVRIPILPNRIFKTPPDASTAYSDNLFNPIWDSAQSTCGASVWNTGTYMAAVRYCVQNNLNVIIDAHQNTKHLCPFVDNVQLTGDQFTAMWRLIATFVSRNIETQYQSLIWFELYNEPVDDNCRPLSADAWNSKYVLPAIKAIKAILPNNYILATTYGDWSGIHSWPNSSTLDGLIAALQSANWTKDDKIIIAGHQYCDTNYDGVGSKGCDPQRFNATLYKNWVQQVQSKLNGFYWMLTEGNVKCNGASCAANNGNLYIEFLQYIIQQPQCLGFTVWLSSLGSSYGGTNMGSNPDDFKSYTETGMYQGENNHYLFADQFL